MARKTSVSRRSFLEQVVGGVVGSTLVVGSASATHGRLTQAAVTDSDSGARADPVGRGRGGRTSAPQGQASSGVTDRDGGPSADPAGQGRSGGGAARSNAALEAENARIRAENRRIQEENRQIEAMRGQRERLEAEIQALEGPKSPQKP